MRRVLKTAALLVGIILLFGCDQNDKKIGELSDLIPENATMVFQISDFESLRSDIDNNALIEKFKSSKPFEFLSENTFLKIIQPSTKSLLCINEIKDRTEITLITRQTNGLIAIDSLTSYSVDTLKLKKKTYFKTSIEDKQFFSVIMDSIFVASSSEEIIHAILKENTEKSTDFKKILKINTTNNDLTFILRSQNIPISDSTELNFASWTGLNLEVLPNGITATGVAMDRDSVPQLLTVFRGLIPQQNDIAKVTPLDAHSAISFTFNDFTILKNNLMRYRKDEDSIIRDQDLFESVSEIGQIELETGNAVFIKSLDQSLTLESLSRYTTKKDSFKEVVIYEFNEKDLFIETFEPLVHHINPTLCFQLKDFFVFTENEAVTQHLITSYLNNNNLSNASFYKKTSLQLSNASSLLILKLNGTFSKEISRFFRSNIRSEIENIDLNEFPLAALQYIYDRDFAHVNLVCQETSKNKRSAGLVSQLIQIQLEEQILNDPQFFTNHRTGGKNIIVQDINNTLYFISTYGKILWKKKLEGPILGMVNEVDILRNGKKQLAFATKHHVHVLDRNGRVVSPFPLKFKDEITQPLSVFDYDNNRKYRFLVTQGSKVFMYDSKGKSVKGFQFKNTKSNIVFPPKHIRIGNKDYILIAEENGKLNILSRVGKHRINISKSFEFSEIPINREGNNFVVITKESNATGQVKNSISQSGKVTSQNLQVSSYWFTVRGNTKVTLDDNLMRINGKLVELPYGIYTPPKIFNINRNIFISITETQENKVYVYNKSGELLSGFPIFGTSSIDMGDVNKNNRSDILVSGGEKEVLVFELQ